MSEPNIVREEGVYLVFKKSSRFSAFVEFVKATRGKPSLDRGQIAIKVKVKIPMSLFDEFIPEAVVELNEHTMILPEVTAEEQTDAD